MRNALNTPPAILVEDLTKVYRSRGGHLTTAVQNLNLRVVAGQVFGFLGANGAGKTTTIKAICGLVLPDRGHITVNGYDVRREHSQAMRQLGAVLEGTRNIYWRLSAWENLLYFGRLKGCRGRTLKERAERLLRELELWDKRQIATRQFSRGMQQKVAIACALIADPPIVLLDEPTLGLDLQSTQIVKDWIRRLVHEQGKTVVLTTHQLDIAQDLCDRIAIMRQGRLLTDQPLSDLLRLSQRERYQIRLKGELTLRQIAAFAPLECSVEDGETVLVGTIRDQDQLVGYLARIHEFALPLIAVAQLEVTLEDVFLRLMETHGHEGEDNAATNSAYIANYAQ
jgi:ABC-2 type transport system ATP-binding protein